MTSDSNLNPLGEIKSTSKSNYLNIKESMNTFSLFFFWLIKVHKTLIKVFYNFYHVIFKDILYDNNGTKDKRGKGAKLKESLFYWN